MMSSMERIRITRGDQRMSQQPSHVPLDSPRPETPPSNANIIKPVQRGSHPRPSVHDIFDELNTGDSTNNSGTESGDERDPHDLSLSPQHATRTSIVDNMLLSLDQFATPNTSVLDDYRLFNSVFESDMHGRNSQDSATIRRHRGHTFSSSLSSEPEYNHEGAHDRYGSHQPRSRRSTSSSNHHYSLKKSASAHGGDRTISRSQLPDYRLPPGVNDSGSRAPRKSSKGSMPSSMEFGPPLVRKQAESDGDGRSGSLDYGSPQQSTASASTYGNLSPYDEIDAAPTPSVPAGPRKYNRPSASAGPRRNSVKSARMTNARKHRPDNLSTAIMKDSGDDWDNMGDPGLEPPPAITGSLDPPAPSPTISFNKPTVPSPPEPAQTKERPGFFRRVFGSSKNAASVPPGPNTSDLSYPQENDSKESNAPAPDVKTSRPVLKASASNANTASRDGPPQVVNKKSSFFRRRKKSVADSVPPPIVLPQEKALDITKPEPSPVSSLRKVMNPYLAEGEAPSGDRSNGSTDWTSGAGDAEESRPGSFAAHKQRESLLTPPGSRSKYSLYPPSCLSGPPDTSLVGKRGGDEASAKSGDVRPASGDKQREETANRVGNNTRLEAEKTTPTLQNRLAPQEIGAPSLSPVAENFSQTSMSPVDAPKEAINLPTSDDSEDTEILRDNTGKLETAGSPGASTSEVSQTFENKILGSDEISPNEPSSSDKQQAQKLYDTQDEVVGSDPAAAWLGDPDRPKIRKAYMELFDWSNLNILVALRGLCNRLVLKGETQQVDRVLDAFSTRWCQCNPNHGFKAADVVHTICYSLLLLNTDLHLADIDQKMTKNQFVRNTMPTIHRVAMDSAPDGFNTIRGSKLGTSPESSGPSRTQSFPTDENPNAEKSSKLVNRLSRTDLSVKLAGDPDSDSGPLINAPFIGTMRAWEQQVETVLRDFYTSIQKQRLPLHGTQPDKGAHGSSNNLQVHNQKDLRRSPSTISKSGSDIFPRGRSADSRSGTARWSSKPRSRAGRLYPPSTMGSSRTSLDDQSSLWSPSGSSTWSKYSLGKLTSASVDSFGSSYPRGDYQQSIGFANALSQAIIREDSANSIASSEDPERTAPLLDDETLQLAGAPWAKEGSLKHKHHLDSVDKRAKDRNWNDCFAVIQQGWMRLFSFNSTTKSIRQKAKQRNPGGIVVGGGNWTENAEEIWKFLLRQTIASALPPPGYSKSRPHVWALSLPTGAVHLFQAGTPEIVREFVSSANYWSARLSKEPLVGGISNIEYGWSDALINNALVMGESNRSPPGSSGHRPSIQSSIRSSIDQQGGIRPKLPADRVNITDWSPPQQSMMASTLAEADQLKSLQSYVKNVEDELQRHNELRSAMVLAFSPRHPNAAKAMANWERKSSYLLREIVKFRTYIDSLQGALVMKNKVYPPREEDEEANEPTTPTTTS